MDLVFGVGLLVLSVVFLGLGDRAFAPGSQARWARLPFAAESTALLITTTVTLGSGLFGAFVLSQSPWLALLLVPAVLLGLAGLWWLMRRGAAADPGPGITVPRAANDTRPRRGRDGTPSKRRAA